MPNSTWSNKEKSFLFSDPALLERTIRKERRAASIDNNPNPSTNSCELLLIDTSTRTLIDIRQQDRSEVRWSEGCNSWSWSWCRRSRCSGCRWWSTCCLTQNVGLLQLFRSILCQQIYYSSSSYSEERFRAEASVLYTFGTNTLLWSHTWASYGPSGPVRGFCFCH